MKSMFLAAALLGVGVLATACDTTTAVAPYSPSTPNVLAFQSQLKSASITVRVGDFVAGPNVTRPTCRLAGALDVSSGKPLEGYIKDALQTELFTAQVYDVNAPVAITGVLDEVKVNTFGTGSWTLGLEVKSNKDPAGYHVETTRTFSSSLSAYAACQNATNSFAPAVQDLIGQVVNNPEFGHLVGKS